jgi:hypothetical protein
MLVKCSITELHPSHTFTTELNYTACPPPRESGWLFFSFLFSFFFFLVVLEFELKALHLLGRCSVT